jgi:ribosomal protein L37AE/L43A
MSGMADCGVCGSPIVYHDTRLGVNVCSNCGAHEVRSGWQPRLQDTAYKGIIRTASEQASEEQHVRYPDPHQPASSTYKK